MAKLFGAQRLVLQAILDSPKDPAGYVTDTQIAQVTTILLKDVHNWTETLEGEGYVEVARTTTGLKVSITAKGRLELANYDSSATTDSQAANSISSPPSQSSAAVQTSSNHSAEELASLLDARLPGVLRLVRAEQERRNVAEKDAQEFINDLERLHSQVVGNLRIGSMVAAHELIGDLRDSVTDFLNDPLNRVVTRFRYIDRPERGMDPEYDSLVDERRRNHEMVLGLYPGEGLAKEIEEQVEDGKSGR